MSSLTSFLFVQVVLLSFLSLCSDLRYPNFHWLFSPPPPCLVSDGEKCLPSPFFNDFTNILYFLLRSSFLCSARDWQSKIPNLVVRNSEFQNPKISMAEMLGRSDLGWAKLSLVDPELVSEIPEPVKQFLRVCRGTGEREVVWIWDEWSCDFGGSEVVISRNESLDSHFFSHQHYTKTKSTCITK
jgi:hypothetical protein